ncbi:MAG: redoxin domain-containing protein [Phaeodactylibacter sp.]|nr:redoxin domain-containing protein [Phaeodactylibacter sp.]MCB9301584.1 redoxin domain-containing protein [Lewinellaceae bacterium]
MAAVKNFDTELFNEMMANTGQSLRELSENQPVLLVFLRHFGCTFCREALSDISEKREEIERMGTKVVFVHMTENSIADRYFSRYGLEGAVHISDPECRYYKLFGLIKGNMTQLFGLQTWIRGFSAGVMGGHGLGPQLGDGFQMPGLFVIQDGVLKNSFIHKLASDRPDYVDLVRCCSVEEES